MSAPDERCCGSGTCIINDAGECWCGQIWDGEKMVATSLSVPVIPEKDQNTGCYCTNSELISGLV